MRNRALMDDELAVDSRINYVISSIEDRSTYRPDKRPSKNLANALLISVQPSNGSCEKPQYFGDDRYRFYHHTKFWDLFYDYR